MSANWSRSIFFCADNRQEGMDCAGTRPSQSAAFHNVTEHPTGAWTAQPIVQAFADRETAQYLIRNRSSRYSTEVQLRIQSLGIEEILTAPQGSWQNPDAERLISSIPRKCLNHYFILNARHLKSTLSS
jgi:hypothetical protein